MSTEATATREDLVTVEIDGQAYQARKGQMIIEVTDANGIEVPRFCYHPKLPVAANCRMCLVQVENVPKPLPACATPVADGMKIFTRSDFARDAQRSVMEFLLINHPLDCPICDQGGECELQDLSLGYGRDVSRFAETKRVVPDPDIGPLIATGMTRCIHCTRCVRFLEHVAGEKELGGIGRGEHTRIAAYIGATIGSELSGNVIDVCPVGALTSKPFRFRARAWELVRHPAVAPHDCLGSNLMLHSRGGQVLRAVPAENEEVNEVWLSDRDRFSYEGCNSDDRLLSPWVRDDAGEWHEASWEDALKRVGTGLRTALGNGGGDALGILASPSVTLEEHFLLAALAEGLDCPNLDHRLRQLDFSDQERTPLFPWLGCAIAEVEAADAILLVGSNIRKEQPLLGLRVRKAARAGAAVMAVNPVDYPFAFPLAARRIVRPSAMATELAGILAALFATRGETPPPEVQGLLADIRPTPEQEAMAARLARAERPLLFLGMGALSSPWLATLRLLVALLAEGAGGRWGQLPDGGDAAGAWLAGVLPHRVAGGVGRERVGLDARAMLAAPRRAYLLYGCEPDEDFADPLLTRTALGAADFVAACTAFESPRLRELCQVLLPIVPFTETAGTLVNCEGRWQEFRAAVDPAGDSRPGWKVLRVLANRLELPGFDYLSADEVREAVRARVGDRTPRNELAPGAVDMPAPGTGLERVGDVPIHAVDALVRRARSLQATPDGQWPRVVRLAPEDARRLGLEHAERVQVVQGEGSALLPLVVDATVAPGAVWIPAALPETAGLGPLQGAVRLEAAD